MAQRDRASCAPHRAAGEERRVPAARVAQGGRMNTATTEGVLVALVLVGLCFVGAVLMCLQMGVWSRKGPAAFWRSVALWTVAIPAAVAFGTALTVGVPVALNWVTSFSFLTWGVVIIICLLVIIV